MPSVIDQVRCMRVCSPSAPPRRRAHLASPHLSHTSHPVSPCEASLPTVRGVVTSEACDIKPHGAIWLSARPLPMGRTLEALLTRGTRQREPHTLCTSRWPALTLSPHAALPCRRSDRRRTLHGGGIAPHLPAASPPAPPLPTWRDAREQTRYAPTTTLGAAPPPPPPREQGMTDISSDNRRFNFLLI